MVDDKNLIIICLISFFNISLWRIICSDLVFIFLFFFIKVIFLFNLTFQLKKLGYPLIYFLL